jgi:hypothetical protein
MSRQLFDNGSLGVDVIRTASGMAALILAWLAYRLHKPDRVANPDDRLLGSFTGSVLGNALVSANGVVPGWLQHIVNLIHPTKNGLLLP